jgi:hypothetical protein
MPVKYTPKHRHLVLGKKCCDPPLWGIAKLLVAGHVRFPWYCRQCGKLTNVYEPKHDHIIYTMVVDNAPETQCEMCGKYGAELHHWAPRHLFGDQANKWPTSYLCQSCHSIWHQAVTPDMGAP